MLSTFHVPDCSENQIAKLLFFLRCQIGVVSRLHYSRDVSGCQITHKSRLVVVFPCQIARLGVPCRKCQIDPISRLSYMSCFFQIGSFSRSLADAADHQIAPDSRLPRSVSPHLQEHVFRVVSECLPDWFIFQIGSARVFSWFFCSRPCG